MTHPTLPRRGAAPGHSPGERVPDDDPQITYSVRDILERMEAKLDSALVTLRLKADHADVVAITRTIGEVRGWQENHDREHEQADTARREAAAARATKRDSRHWLIGAIISALGIAVVLLTAWITAHP